MSDFELAKGRVLHFNEDSWDALQNVLATNRLTLMAQHVTEQRLKDVVVIDIPGCVSPPQMAESLRLVGYGWLADQIEAQTKPPRIPEPGLWGVVEAWRSDQSPSDACTWVKRRGLNPWRCDCGKKADWSDLVDPVLVRDGIEDQP